MRHFNHILCVTSADEHQRSLLERAFSLAENNQARLTCVETVAEVPPGVRSWLGSVSGVDATERLRAERLAALQTFVGQCAGQRPCTCRVLVGAPYVEIIRAVPREGYDLVLKQAEDPGFLPRLFGGDDMHLFRKCPCPVWLTKPGGSNNYATVLAAVDFETAEMPEELTGINRDILSLAGSIALSDFATLHILHVWDTPGEGLIRAWSEAPETTVLHYVEGERQRRQRGMELLQRQLATLLDEQALGYLAPQFHLVRGTAAEAIPATAARLGADLVALGSAGRTGIAGAIVGNTAEAVFEQLQCAVLAIKPRDFVSPIQ